MNREVSSDAKDAIAGAEAILIVLLRYRRAIVATPLAVGVLFVAVSLVLPRKYTTEVVVMPRAESSLGAMAGLAARVGLSLPGGGTLSPRVFAEMATSSVAMRATVLEPRDVIKARPLRDPDTLRLNLVEYFEIVDEGERAVQKAMERLEKRTDVGTDDLAGTLRIRVTIDNAQLSYSIVASLLSHLERSNRESLQSQAAAEREFVSGRLEVARAALALVEDSMRVFLSANRDIRHSPALQVEFERLQRSAALRQQVFATLSQAVEEAMISEVRDTPILTVVNPPLMPAKPDRRRLAIKLVGVWIVSFGLALAGAFAVQVVRSLGASGLRHEDDLEALLKDAKQDLALVLTRVVPSRLIDRRRGS